LAVNSGVKARGPEADLCVDRQTSLSRQSSKCGVQLFRQGESVSRFQCRSVDGFSEWVVDFLANHRPLDEAARRIDVLKAEIALADSL
jgi:hypothetical protein